MVRLALLLHPISKLQDAIGFLKDSSQWRLGWLLFCVVERTS